MSREKVIFQIHIIGGHILDDFNPEPDRIVIAEKGFQVDADWMAVTANQRQNSNLKPRLSFQQY